jgi:hypothetical protein
MGAIDGKWIDHCLAGECQQCISGWTVDPAFLNNYPSIGSQLTVSRQVTDVQQTGNTRCVVVQRVACCTTVGEQWTHAGRLVVGLYDYRGPQVDRQRDEMSQSHVGRNLL